MRLLTILNPCKSFYYFRNMKIYPKLFILLLIVVTACQDDDPKSLTERQLLMKYDWISFSWKRGPIIIDTEPEMEYRVWSFDETDYSGSDYEGTFFNLGEWNLEEDILTLDDDEVIVLELTREKFVYEIEETGTIVTRLPVKKIER